MPPMQAATLLRSPKDRLLTMDDVAQQFGVAHETVRRWVHKRKLPVLKLGGSYRIRESDLVKASELFSTQKLSKKTAGPSLANGLPALNGQQGAQGQDQMNTARANVNG